MRLGYCCLVNQTSNQHTHMKIKIPDYFYWDHQGRALDTPVNHHASWDKVIIDINDTAVEELVDDAAYYADEFGPDAIEDGGKLKRSAIALLKVLFKHRPELAKKYEKLIQHRPSLAI